MRISCSKKFILLHVPRTGGSSVIAALDNDLFVRAAPTVGNKLMSKNFFFVRRPIERTYLRTHETAARVRRLLPSAVFDDYCKIASSETLSAGSSHSTSSCCNTRTTATTLKSGRCTVSANTSTGRLTGGDAA